MSKNYPGLDYSGPGSKVNRDSDTYIRYGIIPTNDVGQSWYDAGEPQYGDPHCPDCGNKVVSSDKKSVPQKYRGDKDYYCKTCKKSIWSDNCFPDQPCGITYDQDGYQLNEDDSGDLWVFKSPYYTYAQFCSPCAPGAGYLTNSFESTLEGDDFRKAAESLGFPKVYCLDFEWFENWKAPYRVFRVEDDLEIIVRENKNPCPNCGGSGRDTMKRLSEVRGVSETQILCQIDLGEINVQDVKRYDEQGNYTGTFKCFRCEGIGTVTEKIQEPI